LHFVTQSLERYDATASSGPSTTSRTRAAARRLRGLLRDEGANVFTTELLTEAAPNVRDLAGLADDDFVLFVEPPSFDARIVNQYALFSCVSGRTEASTSGSPRIPELARRIVVPVDLKWRCATSSTRRT